MPILLGAIASLLIGVTDATGRASSRRAPSITHVTMQMAVGAVIAFVAALALPGELIALDLWAGAGSGIAVASGLAVVYHAMAASSAAVVAPTAAVISVLVPLGWDLATGVRIGAVAGIGCVVAIGSLGLTTFNPNLGSKVKSGLILAVGGGLLLGVSIVLVGTTASESVAWPVVAQRFGGFIAMLVIGRFAGVPLLLPEGVRRLGLLAGITGAAGLVAWTIGSQRGDVGTVSVVASTYPAVVAVLAVTFDDDTLRWWQAIGIAGSIAGAGLIAVAG